MVMSLDARVLATSRYRHTLHSRVVQTVCEIYEDDANINGIVDLVRLKDMVLSDMHTELKAQMVEEAVDRKDYELFNMTKLDFIVKTYSGEFEDVSTEPYIDEDMFNRMIEDYIMEQQFVVMWDNYLMNSPVQEVW
jgi:hypothetical protein